MLESLPKISATGTIRTNDFVTLLITPGPANKRVSIKNNEVDKQAGKPISEAVACTVHVPDQAAMLDLLTNELSENENAVLMLGFFPGTEPAAGEKYGSDFHILSKRQLAQQLGKDPDATPAEELMGWHNIEGIQTTARLKGNVLPSSWMMFDRDVVRGMPPELANMTENEWLSEMAALVPGFEQCGMIRVPSTTGRVTVDGKALEASGTHWYVQIRNPYDLERFGVALLGRSFLTGHGFMRPLFSSKDPAMQVGERMWTITDPSVFSPERLAYEGKPHITSQYFANEVALSVGDAKISVHRPGGRLDTQRLLDPDPDLVAEKTSGKLSFKSSTRTIQIPSGPGKRGFVERRIRTAMMVDNVQLSMDTMLDTEVGKMTLEEYWGSEHKKLRCQTPFRDSTSQNGIVGLHRDGTPFVFDNGTRTKYVLSDARMRRHHAQVTITRLGRLSAEQIRECWAGYCCEMTAANAQVVIEFVRDRCDVNLRALKGELKDLKSEQKMKQTRARDRQLRAEAEADGLVCMMLPTDPVMLKSEIEKVLLSNEQHTDVFSQANQLVHVGFVRPATVREVNRENNSRYPKILLVIPYDRYTLIDRLSRSIAFQEYRNGRLVTVTPPDVLIGALLKDMPQRAPALAGTIEYPTMGLDGQIITANGYDKHTGLFYHINENLVPDLSEAISREAAAASLKWLREKMLADFPFRSDVDRDAVVAMALTAIVRRFLSECPCFAISAPTQASGKTAAVQILFRLVYGRPAAAASWPKDETEMGKVLLGILREGHPAIVFDNVPVGENLNSNELAKAITSPTYIGRILGETQTASVSTAVLWVFTGNNIRAEGDFATRTLMPYLTPEEERPDQRSFSRTDIGKWCEDNRATFFLHALTILIGFQRAGAPLPKTPTRFPEWDRTVRGALLWAGGEDVAKLFDDNHVDDPRAEIWATLLSAWRNCVGTTPITTKELMATVGKHDGNKTEEDDTNEAHATLNTLFASLGVFNARSLGGQLSGIQNRWFGGLRVVALPQSEMSKKSRKWLVECRNDEELA